jgi:hypothetical protein
MNSTLPSQTVIKYSRVKILWFVAMILVAIGGIASLIQGGSIIKYMMAVFCVLIGAWLAWREYEYLPLLNIPQLVISSSGIQTSDGDFYPWQNITNLKVMPMGSPKPTWFLLFDAPTGTRKLHLDGLNRSPQQIAELIRQYRGADEH